MPGDETAVEASVPGQNGDSLSCVACRNRKLKCDRIKPICARCARGDGECVYPESRRKPVFKRKNVRELEARLAQVEDLLRQNVEGNLPVSDGAAAVAGPSVDIGVDNATQEEPPIEIPNVGAFDEPASEDVLFQGLDYMDDNWNAFTFNPDSGPSHPFTGPDSTSPNQGPDGNMFNGELMDLGGIFESLPPFDIMEELNRSYFERQHQFAPVIHPARYLQAFYSAPHMKPPMCLQYAIWALASHGHPKFHGCWKIFYQRARNYAESDEMRGYGEHFITLQHAQAWCCIATTEAKSMLFTRAAMSCARGVRLIEMMGFHRLDVAPSQASPTLAPPKNWAELEERRRVFWGFFCIDSHASISTGWPNLIDMDDVTTHLPSTEAAFHSGEPMETYSMDDVFKGASYTSFAASAVICHVFNQILKHIHRAKEGDHAENYEYGEYWKRHRDLDNTLSSAFMFLPKNFQLPENYRDQAAIHCNINLHASVICLHHAAIEKIDHFHLPDSAKKASQNRLLAAAQEIVNIMKLASHMTTQPKTPLAALSLYCAASVYIYFCAENKTPSSVDNLEFLLSAMAALSRVHTITRSFLRQALLDIEYNGIQNIVRSAKLADLATETQVAHNIPLLARSRITRHSDAQPPLPGRLPLGNPIGKVLPEEYGLPLNGNLLNNCNLPIFERGFERGSPSDASDGPANKRKRGAEATGASSSGGSSTTFWATAGFQNASASTPSTNADSPSLPLRQPLSSGLGSGGVQHNLPHRTSTPPSHNTQQQQQKQRQPPGPESIGDGVTIAPGLLGNRGPKPFTTAGLASSRTRTHQGGTDDPWDLAGVCVSALAEHQGLDNTNMSNLPNDLIGGAFLDVMPDINIDWDALHASLGVEQPSSANGQRQQQ